MNQVYPEPTASLLSYGEPRQSHNPHNSREWPDYIKEFGFSSNDVPYLIQMLKDPAFRAENSNDPVVWAGLHAWRVLGQLQAVDAIPDLLECLDYDDENEVSDWTMEEIPVVLEKIGVAAIEPLSHYIQATSKGCWSITAAGKALECIGTENPEAREACVTVISKRLARYAENEDFVNGFLICNLVDLKAIESLELIRNAFHANTVDIGIGGDVEDTEIRLGVRQVRSTPKPHYHACGRHCLHDEEKQVYKPAPKVGRNDLCPCGSGKKFKKCCLE